ncbi:UspA domain-containing protein [Haloferax elongans ATCC BAA-1513]|uniref:UspA domain-containing protein n=1 Tax=Haloferax elongans ATCC BAA-1513 TaxID=1230453 RepID=M0HQD5_HALEO|nr:universal stress protein [Haloferax elongans]ELZ85948.1 UspA domain-containing protein [Haloferax elongans ATCC BAA-1513]
MSQTNLTSHVLVPVANEDDARVTAKALEPYSVDRVTVVHVVEKGEGVPDKTPVEQSESLAAESFAAFRDTFPDAESEITYRRDVVEGIVDVANDIDASAVAFHPRQSGRIIKLLSGDRTLQLVTGAPLPIIALPHPE